MKTLTSLFVLCAGVFMASGCESTEQMVRIPDQTRGIQEPGYARIYLMRPDSLVDGKYAMPVNANNHGIGYLGGGGYLCWECPAEKVEIRVMNLKVVEQFHFDRVIGGVSGTSEWLSLEPGKTYYLRYKIKMRWGLAEGELLLLNEQEGKAELQKCEPGKYVPMAARKTRSGI
jgi:hypothetical protein